MRTITLNFTEQEVETLKKLIKELDSFYVFDSDYNNRTEEWDFEDVNAQREIALDLANVLRDKF